MDEAPETGAVSITWFIVADLLLWFALLQSSYPDIVGWVSWINDARTPWQQIGIVSTLVVCLPVNTTITL